MRRRIVWIMAWLIAMGPAMALAQSSSLLTSGLTAPPVWQQGRLVDEELQAVSYTAVPMPNPRTFEVNDLVEIVIREASTATSESTLETDKSVEISGSIDAFPRLQLDEFLDAQINQNTQDSDNIPEVDVTFDTSFDGEGEYGRWDTLADRIMARVVDVKPNGTVALEARRWLKVDDEETEVKLTGYCRAEDVTIDNTVLSNQLFDLRIEKATSGEVRNTSKKGLLTKLLDLVFNF